MKDKYKWKYDPKQGRSVREHRLKVKGNANGKDVHHKDGDKTNNSPSNLEPLPKGKHTAITNTETKTKHKTCSVKGCNRPHHAKGLCKYHYNKKLKERL